MIKIGIAGATGYTGHELVRILRRHPDAKIVFATSETYAGRTLSEVFANIDALSLVSLADAPLSTADVVFLCLPHAKSMEVVRRVRAVGVRAIDLSADFRLRDVTVYERWYTTHTAPELLSEAVYGLVELHRDEIRGAKLIANPGCYPTGVILGLHPLAKHAALAEERVIIDAKSSVSGAGRKLRLSSHFVEANENISPYSIGYAHRHISEMEQELQPAALEFIFSPHLLPVNRGILSTMYVKIKSEWDEDRVRALYEETYRAEPFVHVLPAGKLANLRYVAHTNRCVISLTRVDDAGNMIICAAIDNLIKGAAGQAVQNMNVMFDLPETTGLVQ